MLQFKEINQKKDTSLIKEVKTEILQYIKYDMPREGLPEEFSSYFFRKLRVSKMFGKGFSWRLITKKGKLTTRIQKAFRDIYKHKIPSDRLSRWGQKLSNSANGTGTSLKFAISELNWQSGIYGEKSNNCMIREEGAARAGALNFQNAGGRGFLIHDASGAPCGRILFLKVNKMLKEEHGIELAGDVYGACNAYGVGRWNNKSVLFRIFKNAMECKGTTRARIYKNNYSDYKQPWINDDRMYFMGSKEDIKKIKNYVSMHSYLRFELSSLVENPQNLIAA